jgi:hypothetical protein
MIPVLVSQFDKKIPVPQILRQRCMLNQQPNVETRVHIFQSYKKQLAGPWLKLPK